jgi:hypothetical protein
MATPPQIPRQDFRYGWRESTGFDGDSSSEIAVEDESASLGVDPARAGAAARHTKTPIP